MLARIQTHILPYWQRWLLGILILLGILGRVWQLDQPANYVFDEQYHVPAARAVLNQDWRIFDWWQPPVSTSGIFADWLHPPIFKYLQAMAIGIWGDTAWAWRLPSVLASFGVIWVSYKIAERLGGRLAGWTAAALVAMSGLNLVQSRVGMNDMVVTFFGLLSLKVYFDRLLKPRAVSEMANRWQWLGVGVWLGLAAATKWTGWLFVMGIAGSEVARQIWVWRQTPVRLHQRLWAGWPWQVFCLGVMPVLIYFLSYWPGFFSGRGLNHLVELQRAIWQYHLTRDRTHPDQSGPVAWWFNTQPVTYWRAQVTPIHQTSQIIAVEQPGIMLLLWWGLGSWLGGLWRSWQVSRVKMFRWLTNPIGWVLAWAVGLSGAFLFSPRIQFFYHFLPSEVLGIILAALMLTRISSSWWRQWGLGLILVLIALVWLGCYPVWTGLLIPLWQVKQVYWLLPSWR
ncbi:MAG TPA: hypothetical protein DEP87_01610 [Candidatus Pacebacteria bacterium]|nr:hypothetical protein [Candidatus Paceibacterota bacterium]